MLIVLALVALAAIGGLVVVTIRQVGRAGLVGTCSTCQFYKPTQSSLGQCKRYPQPVAVAKDYGCGEYLEVE